MSRLQVWGLVVQTLSQPERGTRNKPRTELLLRVCKSQPTLSDSIRIPHSCGFHPRRRSRLRFKETNAKGVKSASKFADKLQKGKESQPICYTSLANDATFPPP